MGSKQAGGAGGAGGMDVMGGISGKLNTAMNNPMMQNLGIANLFSNLFKGGNQQPAAAPAPAAVAAPIAKPVMPSVTLDQISRMMGGGARYGK
jgi:hypothetical protein